MFIYPCSVCSSNLKVFFHTYSMCSFTFTVCVCIYASTWSVWFSTLVVCVHLPLQRVFTDPCTVCLSTLAVCAHPPFQRVVVHPCSMFVHYRSVCVHPHLQCLFSSTLAFCVLPPLQFVFVHPCNVFVQLSGRCIIRSINYNMIPRLLNLCMQTSTHLTNSPIYGHIPV